MEARFFKLSAMEFLLPHCVDYAKIPHSGPKYRGT
jgi:hypothetical protein